MKGTLSLNRLRTRTRASYVLLCAINSCRTIDLDSNTKIVKESNAKTMMTAREWMEEVKNGKWSGKKWKWTRVARLSWISTTALMMMVCVFACASVCTGAVCLSVQNQSKTVQFVKYDDSVPCVRLYCATERCVFLSFFLHSESLRRRLYESWALCGDTPSPFRYAQFIIDIGRLLRAMAYGARQNGDRTSTDSLFAHWFSSAGKFQFDFKLKN